LPRKRPKYVAAALDYLFGLVGFSSIFHTDNGSEFTAKEILQLLKELCPSILTVTGRPRKPSDQGSVENMNKLAKRILHSVEQEEKSKGRVPNWTRLLGRMMGVVNSQKHRSSWTWNKLVCDNLEDKVTRRGRNDRPPVEAWPPKDAG